MINKWPKYQVVDINNIKESCKVCKANILDLINIRYTGESITDSRNKMELCECRSCKTLFVLHYKLFDKEGHIYPRVFAGDVNDPNYKWQDLLTKEQIKEISKHLIKCKICNNRLSEEILTDAWFGSIIHKRRKKK